MKKTYLLLPAFILYFVTTAQAQTLQNSSALELEADPIAYILKGYSFHAIYNHNHLRYDLGVFGIEEPKFLRSNKNYKAFSNGVGFKVNYLFKPLNSFYTGIDVGIGRTKITSEVTGATDTDHSVSIGGHVGYRVFPFAKHKSFLKGLYLTPWVGLSYNHFYDKVKFEDYKEQQLGYFATLYIGYHF